MERRFPRTLDALGSLFDFVAEFLTVHGLDPDVSFDLDLVVEELFTNLVKYNRDGTQEIAVGLELNDSTVTLTVRDFGVEPWDITRAPEVDTTRPVLDRKAGGLGIHLVKQIADTMKYDYHDRNSTITVTKRLDR